jgi:adenylosuccinate synthase
MQQVALRLDKSVVVAAAAAAALVLMLHCPRTRPLLRWTSWKWLLTKHRHRYDQEDELGDDQEERLKPKTTRIARASKEHFSGAAKCFVTSGYNVQLVADRHAIYEKVQKIARIPELDYMPTARYAEASIEEVLHPLIDSAGVILVPGAYFGDEGKGKTVDAIARHGSVAMVARVNSGENAGHTVVSDVGHKYDFHLCPSGLLTPGKVNVIGPECVMDPVSFMEREVSQLQRTNVEYKQRLFIGNVHLVCPHHKLLDLIGSWNTPNLSTLMGMGPVHASKASRRGLRLDHLFNDRDGPGGARSRLENDLQEYWGALKAKGVSEAQLIIKARANPKVQAHVLGFVEATDKAGYVLKLFDKVVVNNPDFPPRMDVSFMLRETVANGGKVLLEGPQSYFLSNAAEKFWDSGTSACTDAAGLLCAARVNLQAGGPGGSAVTPLSINIHKTPGCSRVGSGANPCSFVPQHYFSATGASKEDFEAMGLDWRTVSQEYFSSVQPNGLLKPGTHRNNAGEFDLGAAMAAATCIHPSHREFGVTSGRPRVVGFFDCVAQAEVMQVQGPYTSISAFDRGDDYDDYAVCIAYVFVHPDGRSLSSNGRVFRSGTVIRAGEQLPTQQILAHCQPILKMVRGWRSTPIFARSEWWAKQKHPVILPQPVCELIDIIEHFTGTTVISIGNGPRADDIIYIKRISKRPRQLF